MVPLVAGLEERFGWTPEPFGLPVKIAAIAALVLAYAAPAHVLAPGEPFTASVLDVKTRCHYTAGMALMNVRLDPDDARRVAELRRAGVQISTILRQAIRVEHEQRVGKRVSARAAAALLARIYSDHPDTPDVAPRGYRLDDRRAVRSAFERRLRKKRT